MRSVAVTALLLGTVVATAAAARVPIHGSAFALGIVAMVGGLTGLRRGRATEAPVRAARVEDLAAELSTMRRGIDALDPVEIESVVADLGELLAGPGFRFGSRVGDLAAAFGTARAAEIIGAFSTAERHLNRAWSAAADGYRDEAARSVDLGREALDAVRDSLSAVLQK